MVVRLLHLRLTCVDRLELSSSFVDLIFAAGIQDMQSVKFELFLQARLGHRGAFAAPATQSLLVPSVTIVRYMGDSAVSETEDLLCVHCLMDVSSGPLDAGNWWRVFAIRLGVGAGIIYLQRSIERGWRFGIWYCLGKKRDVERMVYAAILFSSKRKSLLRTENPDRLYIVMLPSRKYLTYIHAGAIAAGTDDLLQKIVNVRPCLVRIIADRPALIELLWQTYPI